MFLTVRSPNFHNFSHKIALKSHQNRTWFFRILLVYRQLDEKTQKPIFPKIGAKNRLSRDMKGVMSAIYTPKSQFSHFSRLFFAQNRKKSHLVFVYLVGIQAIRRKSEKTHFPKIEATKNPRVNHHGEPEGKTIN